MRSARLWEWIAALMAIVAMGGSASAAEEPQFSYAAYAQVLKTYVNDKGLVDYGDLKANRGGLDGFAREMADLDPTVYEKWTDQQKIALWINAYNALTLQVIIDHYPIKAGFFSSFVYPKNSIRQISGVWDKIKFTVMGTPVTLEGIETKLRKELKDPRIHMAIVCASMSCPKLRNEPYVADRLDEQLDDQARQFMATPSKFRIDRADGVVYLSPIFKWFGQDFVARYGTSTKFTSHTEEERAALNFVSKYVDAGDRHYLEDGTYDIDHLDYDWSLNEQPKK
jgi:hypothetical protein